MSKKYLLDSITDDEFEKLLYYMPNPDNVLNNTGETLSIIEEMKADPHIFAKLEELYSEILKKKWLILPASHEKKDIEIADFVRENINNIDIENDISELLTAVEYGFSVSEVVWKQEEGYYIPEYLKGRSQKRFGFNGKTELIDLQNLRIFDMDYKFIIFRNIIINENPYGQSILTKCFWSWKFKKAGWKFWITLLDKFSVPSVAALFKTDQYSDETKIKEITGLIANELLQLDSGSSAAFGNIDELKVLETSGDGRSFERLISLCNSDISKVITGSTLTSDTASNGNRSLGETHLNTLEIRASKIRQKLETCINRTLIRWMVELNFGINIAPPKFHFETTTAPDWEIVRDCIDRGVPISLGQLYDIYGIPKPEQNNPEDIFVKSNDIQQPQMNFSDFFFQQGKRKIKIK